MKCNAISAAPRTVRWWSTLVVRGLFLLAGLSGVATAQSDKPWDEMVRGDRP
jgi:hypothetical protein